MSPKLHTFYVPISIFLKNPSPTPSHPPLDVTARRDLRAAQTPRAKKYAGKTGIGLLSLGSRINSELTRESRRRQTDAKRLIIDKIERTVETPPFPPSVISPSVSKNFVE